MFGDEQSEGRMLFNYQNSKLRPGLSIKKKGMYNEVI